MRLVWTQAFVRAYKRRSQRDPLLRNRIETALRLLADDPFHPQLRTHKLKGELDGVWACSIDYGTRILFELQTEGEDVHVLLLTLGSHDEVY